MVIFFFFQAEDGIRDSSVTGVQTCALPISYTTLFRSKQKTAYEFKCDWRSNVCSSDQIGRAHCRKTVKISVVAVSLKKKKRKLTTAPPHSTTDTRRGTSCWTATQEREDEL